MAIVSAYVDRRRHPADDDQQNFQQQAGWGTDENKRVA